MASCAVHHIFDALWPQSDPALRQRRNALTDQSAACWLDGSDAVSSRMDSWNLRAMRTTLLAVVTLAISVPALAQSPAQTSARRASRAELESALQLYERTDSSSAYSERTRARARAQAAAVRARLAAGDFRVGDRVQLRVVGPTQLVDSTLAVSDSLTLDVPGIRSVSLNGVLRSELQSVLTRDLGEVVLQAQVTARSLLRVAVVGFVVTPGYLSVSSETLVDELITLAGGPAATAGIEKMQLVRGETVLMQGDQVTRAIAEGATLDALDVRDGDVLVVPPQAAPWDRAATLQIASFVLGPLITIFALR